MYNCNQMKLIYMYPIEHDIYCINIKRKLYLHTYNGKPMKICSSWSLVLWLRVEHREKIDLKLYSIDCLT